MVTALQQEKTQTRTSSILSLKLDEFSFTCGASLQNIDLPPLLNEVMLGL